MLLQLDSQPPAGRNFAMAYRSITTRPSSGSQVGQVRVWEDLRREARKLEGELDVKLAAYAKLCSGFEATYRSKGDSGIGADQLAQTKANEIEDLLERLSDVNDQMGSAIGGSSDSRSHTLARHRDILQEFSQEFKRLVSSLGAARDRAELLASGSESAPLLSIQVQGASGLLRERAVIQSSTAAIDEVISAAQNVSTNLIEQRRIFDNVNDKLLAVGARFPIVNSLLNAIRRKKSKDTIILSAVIAVCVLATLLYIFSRH